jgi:hypothetical protein
MKGFSGMNIQTGSPSNALALSNPWANTSLTLPALGNLDAYISAVNRLPMLSLDEEQTLARQLQKDNDLEAAGKLVLSHLRLVVSVSRQYLGYGLPHGDLIQEGNVGLMKAVKRFDPEAGRAPGELCAALDQGRDPRVHPEELAHGQGGDHQGAAQAVLQPALDEAGPEGRRRHRRRRAPRHAVGQGEIDSDGARR